MTEEQKAEKNRKRREYYQANKQALNAKAKEWNDANKEKRRRYARENYERHKEASVAKSRAYYTDNKTEVLKKHKEYREANREVLSEQKKQYYIANKDRERWKNIERAYGINQQEYEEILSSQDGRCAICGTNDPTTHRIKYFCVDHDHETGEVRGLLCSECNTGIGKLKDSVEVLQCAIDYLDKT